MYVHVHKYLDQVLILTFYIVVTVLETYKMYTLMTFRSLIKLHKLFKCCLIKCRTFQVLSGDRYGFRPVPTELDVQKFMILHEAADTLKLQNKELLNEWYKLDENVTPHIYLLQVRS